MTYFCGTSNPGEMACAQERTDNYRLYTPEEQMGYAIDIFLCHLPSVPQKYSTKSRDWRNEARCQPRAAELQPP